MANNCLFIFFRSDKKLPGDKSRGGRVVCAVTFGYKFRNAKHFNNFLDAAAYCFLVQSSLAEHGYFCLDGMDRVESTDEWQLCGIDGAVIAYDIRNLVRNGEEWLAWELKNISRLNDHARLANIRQRRNISRWKSRHGNSLVKACAIARAANQRVTNQSATDEDARGLVMSLSEKERLLVISADRDLTIGKLTQRIALLEEVIKFKDDVILSLRTNVTE